MIDFAVIMDMDGLMVDSEPLSRRAWDQVLGAYGQTLDDDRYNSIIGYRIDETAAFLIKTYGLPLGIDELAQQKASVHAKIRANGVPPMPGLFEVHSRLIQSAIPWAVATSSPRAHAEEVLKQLGMESSCQAIAGGDEVLRGKPAPDIYLLAAERLGIPASRCLAIEDSAPGCRSALAAGMVVVAVPNKDTKTADFSAADFLFPSLTVVAERLDFLLKDLTQTQQF